MQKLFGFLKQKIYEAKEENKQQIQNIINVVSEGEQYSSQKTLQRLQQIKSNYMKWNIFIANQASTGLYFSQTHSKAVCLRKIHSNRQSLSVIDKISISLSQMKKTYTELQQINSLSGNWISSSTQAIQFIDNCTQKF